jgi:hypothetical protein
MSLIAQWLFSAIFAALSAGTPPAQFDANGNFHAPTHAAVSTHAIRGK